MISLKLKIILQIIAGGLGFFLGLRSYPYVSRYLDRRRITVSKQGIHFEVIGTGQINAHWNDLVGQGLNKRISYRVIRSMIRFWRQFGEGIGFIIRGKW